MRVMRCAAMHDARTIRRRHVYSARARARVARMTLPRSVPHGGAYPRAILLSDDRRYVAMLVAVDTRFTRCH